MSLLDTELAEGRQWLRLGDAYEVTKKPRGLDMASLPAVPFVPMDAIPQGGAYTADYTMRPPGEIRSGTYFERGDALIAKITPSFENGKQALATGLPTPFGIATTEVIPLRPCKEGQDRRLLFFYLLHPDVRHHVAERMEGATGRQRIPADVLLDLPFPKFDPEEQTTVSDILEMIQQLMAVETQSIETTQTLKRSAMRTLFTRGLRGEAQKETEIGAVPESWEVMPFDSAISLKRGFDLPMSKRHEGPVPVFGSNGIVGHHDQRPDGIPIPGVMVGRSGSVGKVSFSADAYWPLNTTLFAEDFMSNIERFMAYFLDNFDFSSFAAGVSVPTLNRKSFAGVKVGIPLVAEQREIAAILDVIDHKIDLHERKRTVLEELFKALLHKLMTGEIRVGELGLTGEQTGLRESINVKR